MDGLKDGTVRIPTTRQVESGGLGDSPKRNIGKKINRVLSRHSRRRWRCHGMCYGCDFKGLPMVAKAVLTVEER